MKKFLLKVSEEDEGFEKFEDLIGIYLVFANDIISIGGHILHKKGDKAFISDVIYEAGYYSWIGGWNEPKISSFKINGITAQSWIPSTFEPITLNNNTGKDINVPTKKQ